MSGRIIAIDYGGKRTGLASSDALGIVASPLEPIVSTDLVATATQVAQVIQEREAKTVVVGMPYLLSGLEGAQCANVRIFISALKERVTDTVEFVEVDERFSSKEAESMLRATGKKRSQLKEHIDSTAAVVLLRQYLLEKG